MPGVGIGGLISNFMNPGLDQTIAKQVTPDPSPLAQQGQGQGPGQGPGQAGGAPTDQSGNAYARAAVTQQDPVAASLAENLVKAQRQSMYAADLNRNIEGMAAGFGTAQQQASKQAALRGAGGGADEIGMWQGIQGINKEQASQNDRARFMGNIHVFAQSLSTALGRPVSDAEAMEIASSPDMTKESAQAFGANSTLTGTTKDADQATASWRKANPNATPEQEAAFRSGIIAMGSGGGNMEDMAYRNYAQAEIAAGRVPDDVVTWRNKHEAAGGAMKTQANDIQKYRDNAIEDYDTSKATMTDMQQWVDTLTKDPAITRRAMTTPLPTTGPLGYWDPLVPTDVKNAAIALAKIKAALSGESLQKYKNVRNLNEFNTLARAATAGLDPASDDKTFKQSLDNLKDRYLDLAATREMVVGHKLTGDLVGHGNRDLLMPKINGELNPWYNGATEEEPPKDGSGGGAGGGAGSAGGGGGGAWPTPEDWQIQRLRANPDKAADFDKKFGPGAAKRVLGR